MKIHRLALEAFGPFPGRQEIDLDELGRDGLFLLTGPTGAGKSTVFEAICFALYGSTTSPEQPRALKSQFSAPQTQPWVELEFSVREHRYLIRRTPSWNRPSKRAKAGFTVQQASVALSRRQAADSEGEWGLLSARPDEAGAAITDLLGLNRAQFSQVVMLPQGRFAQFLSAPSKDREALLGTLFPTGLYGQIRAELKDRARAAEEEAARTAERAAWLEERIEQIEAQVAAEEENDDAASGTGARDGAEADDPAEDATENEESGEEAPARGLSERLDRTLTALNVLLERARTRRDESAARAEALRAEGERLRSRLEQWSRHEELLRRREELDAGEEEHRDRRDRLDSSRRAEPVARAHTELGRAEDRLAAAGEREEQARAALAGLPPAETLLEGLPEPDPAEARQTVADHAEGDQINTEQTDTGQTDPAQTETAQTDPAQTQTAQADPAHPDADQAELSRIRLQVSRVHRAVDAARALRRRAQEAEARHRELQRRHEEQEERARQAAERHAAQQGRLEEIEAERESLRDLAAALPARQEAEEAARRRVQAARRLADLRAGEEAQRERYREAEDGRAEAARAVEELHRRRLEDTLSVLADRLTPGAPCPLCGSEEHPAPHRPDPGAGTEEAQNDAGAVTPERLRAAEARRAEAEELARQAHRELTELSASIAALADDGVDEPEAAQHLLDQAAAGHREAREAAQRAEKLQTERTRLREELPRLETAHREAWDAAATLRGEAQQAAQRLEELGERIEALPAAAELTRRAEQAEEILDAAETVRLARDRRAQTHTEREDRRAALTEALAQTPWEDVEHALPHYLGADAQQSLDQTVREHELRRARFEESWNTTEHLRLLARIEDGETRPDPAEQEDLQRRVSDAVVHRDAALARHTRLTSLHTDAEARRPEIQQLGQDHERQQERRRLLARLSETAEGSGGDNELRMSLTTFILAGQLERIAEAASLRLAEMTGGRYTLHHSDARASKGARSGLGLEVYDAWSSRARPTSSLSGGETFMASLCLALGLADVVQARSGGVLIETLFVDEGFGTLDESTLEDVMDALDGLRAHGRVVGLISHVTELRSRIPRRLSVRRSPEGSTLSTEGA